MKRPYAAIAALSLWVGACSSSSDGGPADAAPAAAAPAPAAQAATAPTSVVGRVPTANGLPSVVVLQPLAAVDVPQLEPPVMDQVALTFIPGVLLVRAGHPVEFRNSDDVLHNVRVHEDATKEGTFNVAIPMGEDYRFTFEREGFYNVGCDIHPAMSATVYVSTSPYFTMTDLSGQFEIANVPPGGYKAIVYAGAERIERAVDVAPGRTDVNLAD